MVMIRIVERADGGPTPAAGKFVVADEYEDDEGRGRLVTTGNPDEARHFETPMEAMEYWTRVHPRRPTRPDGKPNRPLTGFTVEILPWSPRPREEEE